MEVWHLEYYNFQAFFHGFKELKDEEQKRKKKKSKTEKKPEIMMKSHGSSNRYILKMLKC